MLACLVSMAWVLAASAAIPSRPADRDFFHDLAHIIPDGERQAVTNLQQQVFAQTGVPIVVVTINEMREYDPESPSIESFARRWFDSWGIGTQEKNDGMLILVSIGDRKARIELGAQWERRFDEFCQQLMNKKMVPRFKEGNYGKGISDAVASLAQIAKNGPGAAPPGPSLTDRILNNPVMEFNRQNNPIAKKGGPVVIILMMVVGLACVAGSIFLPEYRKPLLIAGVVLIGLAVLFWVVVLIVVLLGRSRGGLHSGGGWGGGGGGGGFGGGSSGGGGASGSW